MFTIVLSGLLYVIPFLVPSLSFLLFVFLLPLFFNFFKKNLAFTHGFVWGVVVFSIHIIWFLGLIVQHGHGNCKVLFWLLTVCWFSFWAGLWFWLVEWLQQKQYRFIVSWLLPTNLFFWFLVHGSLFICDRFEGYPFFNPFVPLAYYPQSIWCLKYLGFIGGLTCLILLQLFLFLGVTQSKKYFICSFVFTFPFLLGFAFYQDQVVDTFGLKFVQPWWNKSDQRKDPIFCGYRMVHDVSYALCEKDVLLVVMPESTFGWNLYEHDKFVPMMCECSETTPILFGSQRTIDGKSYNSCFMIQGGKTNFIYDKQHLVPLVERTPKLLTWLGWSELFTTHDNVFSFPTQVQGDVIEIQNKKFQLFLCSELFFEKKILKKHTILFMCNIDWLHFTYAKRLAILHIKYLSMKNNVSIVSCVYEN